MTDWLIYGIIGTALVVLALSVGGLWLINSAVQQVASEMTDAVGETAQSTDALIANVDQLVGLFQWNIWVTMGSALMMGVSLFMNGRLMFVLGRTDPRRLKKR